MGAELGFVMKGDVVPAGIIFDLDSMETLAWEHDLAGFFCDRNDPSVVSIEDLRYVAPSGGNFVIRTDLVAVADAQAMCRRLIDVCDDTYAWAVYTEFQLGADLLPRGTALLRPQARAAIRALGTRGLLPPAGRHQKLKRRFEGRPVGRAVMRTVGRARVALGRAAGR